jgi:hypothetical protein
VTKPQIICLTPVKNEAWILDRFLACASVWADRIIVADQGSDDGSPEIARRFPKVHLIENSAKEFNEPERQKALIGAARQFPGPRLLIALDADEFLTASFLQSPEWDMVLRAIPGTILSFQWACVLPDRRSYYIFPTELPLGYMDDGAEHRGLAIHSPRLPVPETSPRISLREIKVMHLSTLDFERFRSKIRWYQCWEFLKGRWQSALQLYRWYHRDFCVPPDLIRPLPAAWTSGPGAPAEILDFQAPDYYRWDEEILGLLVAYGTRKFRKLAIWDRDWAELYRKIHGSAPPHSLEDPRSALERWVHGWLERTQPYYSHYAPPLARSTKLSHVALQKVLGCVGW